MPSTKTRTPGRDIRIMRPFIPSTFALLTLFTTTVASPQSVPPVSTASPDPWCQSKPQPAFCHAIRGVRAAGWPAQARSEVMARNGMVVTSQPLAAQAGLQVLLRGGNAVDAAVTTASVLSVTEPMMVGVASDLFAVIYIAKDHRAYVLNA